MHERREDADPGDVPLSIRAGFLAARIKKEPGGVRPPGSFCRMRFTAPRPGRRRARVRRSLQQAVLVAENGPGVAHDLYSLDHEHGLAATAQFLGHAFGNAAFQLEVVVGRAPAPAQKPARGIDRVLRGQAEIHNAGGQGRQSLGWFRRPCCRRPAGACRP